VATGRAAPSPFVERPRPIHVTGYCDLGYHSECAPSAALRAAGGCECPCHDGLVDPTNREQERAEDRAAFDAFQRWRDEDR
jgi:Rieske Fe-S protein